MFDSDYFSTRITFQLQVMPIHRVKDTSPDTQISFLTTNSQTSMNGDLLFSQQSMKREIEEVMDRARPVDVQQRREMSYLRLQLSVETIELGMYYGLRIGNNGWKNDARDGKLGCCQD